MMDGEISSGDEEQKNHPDNYGEQQEYDLNSKRFKEIKSKQANRHFSFT